MTYIPEALTAIHAEEDHWRTVYFDELGVPKQTIVVEKHKQNGYTLAKLDGTDLSLLQRIDDIDGQDITRSAALELRQKYDHNWAARGKLRQRAHTLWHYGTLRPIGAGALGASIDLSGITGNASAFAITIAEDGTLSTEITDPVQTDDFDGRVHHMDWHEYELPRHVSYARHRVMHTGGEHSIVKTVYNPLTVVRQMHEWFKVAEVIARN